MTKVLWFFGCSLLVCSLCLAGRASRLPPEGPLQSILVRILDESVKLHDALVSDREPVVITQLHSLEMEIVQGERFAESRKNQDHLNRILNAAKNHIVNAQQAQPDDRPVHLKSAYGQLVLLARSYSLSKEFPIYFCSKDRSTWIQNRGTAQNPFHTKPLRSCGREIRK